MDFDGELSKLAEMLRVGADTARAIAVARKRDEATIVRLAVQADEIADEIDGIVDDEPQPPSSFRLRRDR